MMETLFLQVMPGMGMGIGMGKPQMPQMGAFQMGFQGNPMMSMGGFGGFNPMMGMGMGMGQMGMMPNAYMGMGIHPGMMGMQVTFHPDEQSIASDPFNTAL